MWLRGVLVKPSSSQQLHIGTPGTREIRASPFFQSLSHSTTPEAVTVRGCPMHQLQLALSWMDLLHDGDRWKKCFYIIRPYFKAEEGSCVCPIVLKGHIFTFQALGKPPDLPSLHWTRTQSQKTTRQVKTPLYYPPLPAKKTPQFLHFFKKKLIQTHHFEGPAQLHLVEVSDCAQHHSIRVPSGTALSNLTSVMAFFFFSCFVSFVYLPPSKADIWNMEWFIWDTFKG